LLTSGAALAYPEVIMIAKFTESVAPGRKAQAKAEAKGHADTYLIDSSEVAAVMPRKHYTTLLVQGRYIHVTDLADEVCRKIGWDSTHVSGV
jgi:hypothetical protein